VLLLSGLKLLDPLPGNWTNIAVLIGVCLGVLGLGAWAVNHAVRRRANSRRVLALAEEPNPSSDRFADLPL
jgi:hypothetical protein